MDPVYIEEEHRMLREQADRFVREEVLPHGDAWETAGAVPREVLRKMGSLGLLGIRYPEEYGGAAMNTVASVVLHEALGKSSYSGFAVTVGVHSEMASPHLARFGTAAQKKKYMPGIVKGEIITAIGVTEPDAGSDVAGMRTTAKRKGNNAWVLNGSKMFITNGVLADVYFIAAKTDLAAKGSRGVSIFIVDKNTKGFKVARKLDKMGWRCSDTAELVFEDCEVSADNMLGEENKGFYSIMQNFQNERLVAGAIALGECAKAMELTIDYVKTRKAFGATLWDKQLVRTRLAELAAKIEAARQLTYHTAWLDQQGIDCVKEVSMVKAILGELVNEVVYKCLQFHGGSGYMRETPIERMYRDARVQAIGGGATEVMLEEIAKRM